MCNVKHTIYIICYNYELAIYGEEYEFIIYLDLVLNLCLNLNDPPSMKFTNSPYLINIT